MQPTTVILSRRVWHEPTCGYALGADRQRPLAPYYTLVPRFVAVASGKRHARCCAPGGHFEGKA